MSGPITSEGSEHKAEIAVGTYLAAELWSPEAARGAQCAASGGGTTSVLRLL